jgi:nucleoside-diphosphate-sugar epimerase
MALREAANERPPDDIVLVHDAVRPLISEDLISAVLEKAAETGSAVTCTPANETAVISRGGESIDGLPERSLTWAAQAPQAFRLCDLLAAHGKERSSGSGYDGVIDSVTLMRRQGIDAGIVRGPHENIKITYPSDVDFLRGYLEARGVATGNASEGLAGVIGAGVGAGVARGSAYDSAGVVSADADGSAGIVGKVADGPAGAGAVRGFCHETVLNDIDEILLRIGTPGALGRLCGKTVLIAGAGGLIASYVAMALLEAERRYGIGMRVVCMARDCAKARVKYARWIADESFTLLERDIGEDIAYEGAADYVVHAGGSSAPRWYMDEPAGIFRANTAAAVSLLEIARKAKAEKFLYLSSREVYGEATGGAAHEYCSGATGSGGAVRSGEAAGSGEAARGLLSESDYGAFDHLNIRNIYPESKRATESALVAYAAQYGVPCAAVRLASVYGPGMKTENDGRAISDIVGAAVRGEDIALNSDGSAIRSYCYVTDAVCGILKILLADDGDGGGEGSPPEPDTVRHEIVYNLANEDEPLPIREIAGIVAKVAGVGVSVPERPSGARAAPAPAQYSAFPYIALDTGRIRRLGWKPEVKLADGIARTLAYHCSGS